MGTFSDTKEKTPPPHELPSGVFDPEEIHISPELEAMIKEIVARRKPALDEMSKWPEKK